MKKRSKKEIDKVLALKTGHCEACGSVLADLDAHHWCHKTRDNYSKPWNIVTLCRRCHQYFHTSGAYDFLDTYEHLRDRYNHARTRNRLIDAEETPPWPF